MKKHFLNIVFAVALLASANAQDTTVNHPVSSPGIHAEKIWGEAPHNAFTDLVYYKNNFYCTFRESAAHVPKSKEQDGMIRVLISPDAINWKSFAVLGTEGYDLRDPNFAVMTDGRLMLLMGGSVYDHGKLLRMHNHVSFMDQAVGKFSDPAPVVYDKEIASDNNWLWHLSWDKKIGYGVIYQKKQNEPGRNLLLLKTKDGIHYSLVTKLDQDGLGNETAVHFLPDHTMMLAMRRDAAKGDTVQALGYWGSSKSPYKKWKWTETNIRMGGPELLALPGGQLVLGTRAFKKNKASTGIFLHEGDGRFKQLLEVPSGGDNSYPGMVVRNGNLYISYYSSHEGKAQIYLATVPLSEINQPVKAK